jgi:hypothetical protein
LKHSVRNEAQLTGIGAIIVAVAVLVLFFVISQSGLGSSGSGATGAAATQSSDAGPR